MGMPNDKELKKVLKKLEKEEGSLGRPLNPTPTQAFRYELQQNLLEYKLKHKLSGKEFAKLLGVDEAKVSKLVRNRISEFSTDRMLLWCEKIYPDFKIELIAS